MARPLLAHNIGQLEALFEASKTEVKMLKQLEGELRHRKVPRAVALRTAVQEVIQSSQIVAAQDFSDSIMPPVTHHGVLTNATVTANVGALAVTLVAPVPAASAVTMAAEETDQAQSPVQPCDPITAADQGPRINSELADAYRTLRASPNSTWETIELNRRQFVQQTHPDSMARMTSEQRLQIQDQVERINAAYALIRQRHGG
jgi:hypothetical protein